MSRRTGLSRPIALLIAVLSLALVAAAPASASDKSLRAAVVGFSKQAKQETKRFVVPDQDSPTYAADFQRMAGQVDDLSARFAAVVTKQHGSTRIGREARRRLLAGIAASRKGMALIVRYVRREADGGDGPSAGEIRKANALLTASDRNVARGYKLLRIRYASTGHETGSGTDDGTGVDEDDDGGDEPDASVDAGDDSPAPDERSVR